MKITIRDTVPAVPQVKSQRLAKPAVEIETVLYGIALLRVSLGLLFLAHGLLKVMVFTLPGTAQFFTTVGLPGLLHWGQPDRRQKGVNSTKVIPMALSAWPPTHSHNQFLLQRNYGIRSISSRKMDN